MNWVCQRKRGYLISHSIRVTVCLHALSQSLKRIYYQSQQLSCIARESFSSLFGESEAGESVPSVPQALFTRSILQRCQEKPQTILENRPETLLRIHQWAQWNSRAWFAPFWRSNKLTPWIICCCEAGYTCPRVFSFSKTSVSFTSAIVSFPITYFLLKWHCYSSSNNSPEGILQAL